jgi:hypothetical protein
MNAIMEPEIVEVVPSSLPAFITREQLAEIETRMRHEAMKDGSGFYVGDHFPLTHRFADGIYVREIRVPAGNYVVTKLFRQEHATFLLQGEVIILSEKGRSHKTAPDSWITPVGTKRLIYVIEDCIWTTVHANPKNDRDVDQIEKFVIAESYAELEAPKEKGHLCLG